MSSSTSSSEPEADGAHARQTLLWAGVAMAAALIASLVFIVATDPYDRGHPNLIGDRGVPEFGQPLRNAGIARQTQFDSALIGNSTLQLVNPEAVERIGGGKFLSLTMLGAGPLEEQAIADWFLVSHRKQVRALVIGIDESWCQPDAPVKMGRPFPFWLYGRSTLAYLAGVTRFDSLKHGVVRIAVATGHMPRMRPNGYEDYEPLISWRREVAERKVARKRDVPKLDPRTASFPALAILARLLADLDPTARAVLVLLPRFHASIPIAGSNHYDLEANCRTRLLDLTAKRPRTVLLDLLVDDTRARAVDNWWDAIHYRGTVARQIEREIGEALAKIDGVAVPVAR